MPTNRHTGHQPRGVEEALAALANVRSYAAKMKDARRWQSDQGHGKRLAALVAERAQRRRPTRMACEVFPCVRIELLMHRPGALSLCTRRRRRGGVCGMSQSARGATPTASTCARELWLPDTMCDDRAQMLDRFAYAFQHDETAGFMYE